MAIFCLVVAVICVAGQIIVSKYHVEIKVLTYWPKMLNNLTLLFLILAVIFALWARVNPVMHLFMIASLVFLIVPWILDFLGKQTRRLSMYFSVFFLVCWFFVIGVTFFVPK